MTDLLRAAADEPILLAVLVGGGFLVWAIERLSGAEGPLTRAVRAWQERELRRLRYKRAVREEQRAARLEEADSRVVELESEVAWLREQLRRNREGVAEEPANTEPLARQGRRNSARPPVPPR